MLSNHSTQQTEVKLLKDEKWKVIQQNTFTRWVNKQLKHSANSPQLENVVILLWFFFVIFGGLASVYKFQIPIRLRDQDWQNRDHKTGIIPPIPTGIPIPPNLLINTGSDVFSRSTRR